MATVTPNFNWPVPTSTDLVRDGAVAIEALGDSIDASLVDLKGGTSGQVLAKASNTDMDFAWVAQDDSNAIQNSIVDAKGDLIAATANDTPARLAVGANGETLVADSSTSTGLRYQSAYNGNGIINGGMDIWQRGTSFALTSPAVAYTADRWLGRHFGTNVTYSQQTSGLTGIQYSLRIQRPNGTTGLNEQAVYYQFETADSYRFAGQTVTLSFWAKAGANFSATSGSMIPYLITGTGTNQNITSGAYTGQATVSSTPVTLTTSWQRFSVTGTIASTATQIALIFVSIPTGTAGANDWFEITGAQLELGSVATSFKRSAGGTIQGELAACQRYYYQMTIPSTGQCDLVYGYQISTTAANFFLTMPSFMRVIPTPTATNLSVSDSVAYNATVTSIAMISAASMTSQNYGFTCGFASAGAQYRPAVVRSVGSSATSLSFSAEL